MEVHLQPGRGSGFSAGDVVINTERQNPYMKEQNHRSTSRVLDIFELLAHSERGLTLTELAKEMDAPKSSIFPIIHTMEERQFVQCDAASSRYRIGYQSYLVGGMFRGDNPFYAYISDKMKEITDACMETTNLGMLVGPLATYLAVCESPNPVGYRAYVGIKFPAYCSGIGKALLINKSKEELRELYPEGLESKTPNTITDFDQLYNQLQLAKLEGFTYEDAEAREEIYCVGVPLFNKNEVVAALSVSVPRYRLTDEKIGIIRQQLQKAREQIQQYLEKFNITDGWALVS